VHHCLVGAVVLQAESSCNTYYRADSRVITTLYNRSESTLIAKLFKKLSHFSNLVIHTLFAGIFMVVAGIFVAVAGIFFMVVVGIFFVVVGIFLNLLCVHRTVS
jgi:hypothetical protein